MLFIVHIRNLNPKQGTRMNRCVALVVGIKDGGGGGGRRGQGGASGKL